jgi:hypothetical protein
MRKSSFIKHIQQLGEEDLRDELTMLFTKVKAVSEFYKMELGTEADRKKLYDKAKANIRSKFATKSYRRPRRPRVQKVNMLLKELKDKAIFDYEMIDIYLFTCETALEFCSEYEFISVPVSNIIMNTYDKAIHLISHNNMDSDYKDRCSKIIDMIYFDDHLHQEVYSSYLCLYDD